MAVKKSDKFFNTTDESTQQAKDFAAHNETQNDRILKIYKAAKQPLSASQVHEKYGGICTPLTSIRRGITQLMNGKKLEKTEFMREGLYGRREYYYQLKRAVKQKKSKEK